MKVSTLFVLTAASAMSLNIIAEDTLAHNYNSVSDEVVAQQRQHLAENTEGKGFGPQAPRDIDSAGGQNNIFVQYCSSVISDEFVQHTGYTFTKMQNTKEGSSPSMLATVMAKVNIASVGEWCKGNVFDLDSGIFTTPNTKFNSCLIRRLFRIYICTYVCFFFCDFDW